MNIGHDYRYTSIGSTGSNVRTITTTTATSTSSTSTGFISSMRLFTTTGSSFSTDNDPPNHTIATSSPTSDRYINANSGVTHNNTPSVSTTATHTNFPYHQLIYDAYREYETDGIIELGTIMEKYDIECDDTIDTLSTTNEPQKQQQQQNPMNHLSALELWEMTLVAAQRIAQEKKPPNRKNQMTSTSTKQTAPNQNHSTIPCTGIAASMLNGWIAAAAVEAANNNHHQRQHRVQYGQELFRIATTGDEIATPKTQPRKNQWKPTNVSIHPKTNTKSMMVVEPDMVTYSLLYTLLYPTDPILAESYLQLAQRQSKKIAGTQRRKLLSKSSSSSVRPTHRTTTMFRDYEHEIQTFLSLSTPSTNHGSAAVANHHHVKSKNDDALILYENENFVVLNKPSGTCCYHTHTTTAGKRNVDLSLMDVLQKFRSGRSTNDGIMVSGTSLSTLNPVALGIVHRLDRGTSGCIVIAKNNAIHARFVAAIFQRQFQKTYTVLVSPAPCIEAYHPTTGYITIPVDGKPAKSKYTVLERFVRNNNVSGTNETAALMNVTTYTGRQHQVRVHCAHGLGTPIIGDSLYSTTIMASATPTNKKGLSHKKVPSRTDRGIDQGQERFHLHAASITVPSHLGEEFRTISHDIHDGTDRRTVHLTTTMTYDAPIPTWWQPVLDEWRP